MKRVHELSREPLHRGQCISKKVCKVVTINIVCDVVIIITPSDRFVSITDLHLLDSELKCI